MSLTSNKHNRELILEGVASIDHAAGVAWSGIWRLTSSNSDSDPLSRLGFERQISMPTAPVPVVGGAPRALVAGRLPLNIGEGLFYKITGNIAAFDTSNFVIRPLASEDNVINSEDEVLVVRRWEKNLYEWGNDEFSGTNWQIGHSVEATIARSMAAQRNASTNGYHVCTYDGGSRVAYGFTGQIMWVGNGAQPGANTHFARIDTTACAAGQVVTDQNGNPHKTWRLADPLDKLDLHGGARASYAQLRINPATMTLIDLDEYDLLCWVPDLAATTGDNAGQWRIVRNSGSTTVVTPPHWLPVVQRMTTHETNAIVSRITGEPINYNTHLWGASRNAAFESNKKILTYAPNLAGSDTVNCRFASQLYFNGTGDNGRTLSSGGAMLNWANDSLSWGISNGSRVASVGSTAAWLNMPAVGTKIRVLHETNLLLTRVVDSIGGKPFIPLGNWDCLYYIPESTGVTFRSINGSEGEYVVTNYNINYLLPPTAVLIARVNASQSSGVDAHRLIVWFAGIHLQCGSLASVAGAPIALYDQMHGTGAWRNATLPGGTPPAGTAALPAFPGSVGSDPLSPVMYRPVADHNLSNGLFQVRGTLFLSGYVPNGTRIAFLPGVSLVAPARLHLPFSPENSTATVNSPKSVLVIASNTTIGGQNGVVFTVTGGSATAGQNGNPALWPGGTAGYISFDNLTLFHG